MELQPERVQVAICFLAHEGMTQPSVWEKFRDYSGGSVGYSIHTNKEIIPTLPAFLRSVAVENPIPTAWFDMSLVLASQLSFKMAFNLYPNAKLFVLLPGNSVPCCSPKFLVDLIKLNQFFLCDTQGSNDEPGIGPINGGAPPNFFCPSSFVPVEHSQFVAIRRQDVELLDEALKDMDPWFALLETSRFANCCLRTPPDEFVIGTALCSAFSRDQCNFEMFTEICFCMMYPANFCDNPDCQTTAYRGKILTYNNFWVALRSFHTYKTSIAIRKVRAEFDSQLIWTVLLKMFENE